MTMSRTVHLGQDAVIVVPGIMGSALVDAATGSQLWGLSDSSWLVRAWTSGSSLAALKLTDDERAGNYSRVRATQLIRFPAWAPLVQGIEPYTRLLSEIGRALLHEAALREFPYDWRLPVEHNAKLLARAAQGHLAQWRRHPALTEARRESGIEEPRLVIVAHSMGGLLVQHMGLIPGAMDGVRAVVTLGTPFHGAVKAAVMLNAGRGFPLPVPTARLQDLAGGLPGLHDLLPMYRCVDTGADARRLSASDVAGIGGDKDLAAMAASSYERRAAAVLPRHVQVIGARQPTLQSLTIAGGMVTGHSYTCRPAPGGVTRTDLAGDGTVARDAAETGSGSRMPLAQTHGALARSNESVLVITDLLASRETGPWLGAGEIGMEIPDTAITGRPFEIRITGVAHPRDASCTVFNAYNGRRVDRPGLTAREERISAFSMVAESGLYRVEAAGGGTSPVSQLLLATGADS